jgi:hypothetical protein
VLRQYVRESKRESLQKGGSGMGMDDFQLGRLAVGLEMLTQLKILRDLPFTELTVQLEAAFQAFLVDQGLIDDCEVWYDRLDAWRAPKFVGEGVGATTRTAFGASSLAASGEGALARTLRYRQSLEEHQSLDETATSASEESPDGED